MRHRQVQFSFQDKRPQIGVDFIVKTRIPEIKHFMEKSKIIT